MRGQGLSHERLLGLPPLLSLVESQPPGLRLELAQRGPLFREFDLNPP